MSPVLLILLSIFSLVSATGHLRIEFTASNNCALRMITAFSDETIQLSMGEKRVSSFHPAPGTRDKVRLSLSTASGKSVVYDFALKNTGQQIRNIYEDTDLVVLIQSSYECNEGFFGLTCEFVGTSSITTTTTATTTTVSTTTESKKTTPTESPLVATTQAALFSDSQNNSTTIFILVAIIILLTALIIVFGCLLISSRRSPQHLFLADKTKIEKETFSAENKGKLLMEEEHIYEEIRYTTAPLRSIFSQKSEN
ncbi:Protein CBR-SDZ-31 [Caenorhabditis briggsae]|uniref:Uncharacterized protein n=2 Tax=Caenorhabditis briggsae TaxID=6238 RepID=A0AAE9JN41_CAEBR|nr:Protein CBR-SDZ-31 [Caenorhabditis briggsae]ULT90990.1 hypothetical protein L3Y34_008940 [Caenorhabditis briggsae]UMM36760.1 hypothetical protein L5515_008780 [Caenorhabditis briggsae]CAP36655.1 Protein CBR-SDZ-31 [Caenorhabditis briggsae]